MELKDEKNGMMVRMEGVMQWSAIGMGTYLGAADEETDRAYLAAARAFHSAGGTVFDTAANYRRGRSERVLGRFFRTLPRHSFFVSTKAGYLPMGDGRQEESPREWFRRVLAEPGILAPEEVVDGCHSLAPRYLEHQLGVSLEALGVEAVDVFHLHNPEHQRPQLGPGAFRKAMREAFEACEALVARGKAKAYGCATWNGFRVPPEAQDHLSLEELLQEAEGVGGQGHHFRWVQLPINLAMPEALTAPTQAWRGRRVPLLEAALEAGLQVQASASLLQSRFLADLPAGKDALLPGCRTPAQGALQFVRSCPGVAVALCGMSRVEHVQENMEILGIPPAEAWQIQALVGKPL
jgi:aryl-alcohol dehydrogenase-like predicted oxidoreductase